MPAHGIDGIIAVNKPSNWTSFDVVAKVRSTLGKFIRERSPECQSQFHSHERTNGFFMPSWAPFPTHWQLLTFACIYACTQMHASFSDRAHAHRLELWGCSCEERDQPWMFSPWRDPTFISALFTSMRTKRKLSNLNKFSRKHAHKDCVCVNWMSSSLWSVNFHASSHMVIIRDIWLHWDQIAVARHI